MLNQRRLPSKAKLFRARSVSQGHGNYHLIFGNDHLKKVLSMLNQGGPPSKACFSGLDPLGKA
ncbi:hypothetical protein HMPREF9708_00011 [Facklamia languida CCUG 37842]|uniref:Uncharacterized protein n=1 Tax=Facklamia languida CCUG 37842 TaxID=883113 RepID=H3NGM2_9LACT|nr:hypothetical protein HMPREF9708_00011 [Facklamia languida CCUG 37842]